MATEVFQGTAPPGLGLLGLNVTDHGFARFTSSLPCPLIIYPLSEAEYQAYTDSGSLPPQALHCDNPSVVKGQPVSYLLIRNVGPEESLDYTVEGEFLRAIRPYHWMAIPGLILLVGGAIPLLVMFLMRGILQLGKSLEEDSEQNKGLKK
ncbi:MAG: hypothetical protein GTO63_06400 [Anaerolineae bacterium]|nr:hypothetical protein [Anaerolineae bacterium]NIN94603.1 hypothetical protein [Anaerolineae bacterium]